MDYECMYPALQTIRAAHLFHEYGKMDRLLECGVTQADEELYSAYYDLLCAACDYMD